jgi:hypothetical protein
MSSSLNPFAPGPRQQLGRQRCCEKPRLPSLVFSLALLLLLIFPTLQFLDDIEGDLIQKKRYL